MTNMDEEDYRFVTLEQQLRYPEEMRDKRGEDTATLFRKEHLRHDYDKLHPEAAAAAKADSKRVKENLKKKALKQPSKK